MPVKTGPDQVIVICCGERDCRPKIKAALEKLGVDFDTCDLIAVPGGAGPLRPNYEKLTMGSDGKLYPGLGTIESETLLWVQSLSAHAAAKVFIIIAQDCHRYASLAPKASIGMQREHADDLAHGSAAEHAGNLVAKRLEESPDRPGRALLQRPTMDRAESGRHCIAVLEELRVRRARSHGPHVRHPAQRLAVHSRRDREVAFRDPRQPAKCPISGLCSCLRRPLPMTSQPVKCLASTNNRGQISQHG